MRFSINSFSKKKKVVKNKTWGKMRFTIFLVVDNDIKEGVVNVNVNNPIIGQFILKGVQFL